MKHNPSMRDDNGVLVYSSDKIWFSYGIPHVSVVADVVLVNGKLCYEVKNHGVNDGVHNLRSLRRHVGWWYKELT